MRGPAGFTGASVALRILSLIMVHHASDVTLTQVPENEASPRA
jgi:hypothetical protein